MVIPFSWLRPAAYVLLLFLAPAAWSAVLGGALEKYEFKITKKAASVDFLELTEECSDYGCSYYADYGIQVGDESYIKEDELLVPDELYLRYSNVTYANAYYLPTNPAISILADNQPDEVPAWLWIILLFIFLGFIPLTLLPKREGSPQALAERVMTLIFPPYLLLVIFAAALTYRHLQGIAFYMAATGLTIAFFIFLHTYLKGKYIEEKLNRLRNEKSPQFVQKFTPEDYFYSVLKWMQKERFGWLGKLIFPAGKSKFTFWYFCSPDQKTLIQIDQNSENLYFLSYVDNRSKIIETSYSSGETINTPEYQSEICFTLLSRAYKHHLRKVEKFDSVELIGNPNEAFKFREFYHQSTFEPKLKAVRFRQRFKYILAGFLVIAAIGLMLLPSDPDNNALLRYIIGSGLIAILLHQLTRWFR